MKRSCLALFLTCGGLASSLCTAAIAQHSGCGAYGPEPATCPYNSRPQAAAESPALSPWNPKCWLAVQPPVDSDSPTYQGCDAGCPADAEGCAAAKSAVVRDIWEELYSRNCCPETAPAAAEQAAAASDMGCLAADERHSRGQEIVEFLNEQQQGLSGTHLTVRLRVGPVAEDDAFAVEPELPAEVAPAPSVAHFDDEEPCMCPDYGCLGDQDCYGEFDYDCGADPKMLDRCQVEADEYAPSVASRAADAAEVLDDDIAQSILRESAPLVPEIIRQDLAAPAVSSPEPWANEAIDRANGQAICRSMVGAWAYAARCGGECLRSLSHVLSELADNMAPTETQHAELPSDDVEVEADEAADASHQIPDEYLGW